MKIPPIRNTGIPGVVMTIGKSRQIAKHGQFETDFFRNQEFAMRRINNLLSQGLPVFRRCETCLIFQWYDEPGQSWYQGIELNLAKGIIGLRVAVDWDKAIERWKCLVCDK